MVIPAADLTAGLAAQIRNNIGTGGIGTGAIGQLAAFRKYLSIDPTPFDNGSQIVFEYVSNGWCQNASTGAPQLQWEADTDVGVGDLLRDVLPPCVLAQEPVQVAAACGGERMHVRGPGLSLGGQGVE